MGDIGDMYYFEKKAGRGTLCEESSPKSRNANACAKDQIMGDIMNKVMLQKNRMSRGT